MTTEVSKHTPGPWTVVSHGGFISIFPQGVRKVEYPSQEIATCHNEQQNAKANAALIAAAPALLEALQAFVESVSLTPPGANKTLDKARAAIAQALGEEAHNG